MLQFLFAVIDRQRVTNIIYTDFLTVVSATIFVKGTGDDRNNEVVSLLPIVLL
jgi:hypothetical protein